MHRLQQYKPEVLQRVHIFSSFLFAKLAQKGLTKEDRLLDALKWSQTQQVDIFSKDYVFLPICEKLHWTLAVICFPGAERTALRGTDRQVPCILHLNSIRKADTAKGDLLRLYLQREWDARRCSSKGPRDFTSKQNMPMYFPYCPQQRNEWDCGIFVLDFLERMCGPNVAPDTGYGTPEPTLKALQARPDAARFFDRSDWFDVNAVDSHRRMFREHIERLVEEQTKKLMASTAGNGGVQAPATLPQAVSRKRRRVEWGAHEQKQESMEVEIRDDDVVAVDDDHDVPRGGMGKSKSPQGGGQGELIRGESQSSPASTVEPIQQDGHSEKSSLMKVLGGGIARGIKWMKESIQSGVMDDHNDRAVSLDEVSPRAVSPHAAMKERQRRREQQEQEDELQKVLELSKQTHEQEMIERIRRDGNSSQARRRVQSLRGVRADSTNLKGAEGKDGGGKDNQIDCDEHDSCVELISSVPAQDMRGPRRKEMRALSQDDVLLAASIHNEQLADLEAEYFVGKPSSSSSSRDTPAG